MSTNCTQNISRLICGEGIFLLFDMRTYDLAKRPRVAMNKGKIGGLVEPLILD